VVLDDVYYRAIWPPRVSSAWASDNSARFRRSIWSGVIAYAAVVISGLKRPPDGRFVENRCTVAPDRFCGGLHRTTPEEIMRRLFRAAFFACGTIGLLLNLVFILVAFDRETEFGSALATAMEATWIGGMTFFGLGALILEDQG
jgi:hypothetical protein